MKLFRVVLDKVVKGWQWLKKPRKVTPIESLTSGWVAMGFLMFGLVAFPNPHWTSIAIGIGVALNSTWKALCGESYYRDREREVRMNEIRANHYRQLYDHLLLVVRSK